MPSIKLLIPNSVIFAALMFFVCTIPCCCAKATEIFYNTNSPNFYWPIWLTTTLLFFSNDYPVLFIHTAVNLSAITHKAYISKNKIEGTIWAVVSMFLVGWIKIVKEYRLINFPGIFEDYDYFINPPMNSAFMLIV